MPAQSPAEIQQLLREGIQAIRAGDRSRGRRLLLDVVRADERNGPAWLWLSDVLDDPADQIMALENALALNPGNTAARQRLAALQATGPGEAGAAALPPAPTRQGPPEPAPPPEPEPEPAPEPGPALTMGFDPDDDPLQCPFCGRTTAEAEDRCPHCRRSLLAPGPWQAGCYLYLLLILMGLNVQAALLEGVLPLIVPSLTEAGLGGLLTLARLGDGLMSVPFALLLLRFVLLGGVLALLLNDASLAYPAGAAVLTLDVAGHLAAAWYNWLPGPVLTANLALSAAGLLLAGGALISQQFARRRLFTQLDRDVHGGLEFHRRGQEHLRHGRVALALQHFQKAVVLEPRAPGYYKDLAAAQARLGRWRKARQTLQAGQRRAPDDPEFARRLAEVERRL
jgi:tetratricopeptide (TPR) repeat protein